MEWTQGGSYVLSEMDGTISRRGIAAFGLLPYITWNSRQLRKLAQGLEEAEEEVFAPDLDGPIS
jgi:hypothetical protein